MAAGSATPEYAVRFDVDYPDRELNRRSSAFRIIWAIPIVVVLAAMANASVPKALPVPVGLTSAGGVLFIATALMIVFRQKYPRWWFDWNLELSRFSARVGAYFVLLRDEYPSTDEEQAVHLEIDYPDVERDLNRWLPLVKWFLAIPHYIVLIVLFVVVIVLIIIAWFAILFTGRYPRGIFNFVVGTGRWAQRVGGYAFLLVTDRYPPFSLE